MATVQRKTLNVHGGDHPFSLMALEKRAYLHASDVAAVIVPLDPSRQYPAGVFEELAATMASYLGPRLLKRKHPSHGASLRALAAIARDSARLARRIESLDQDYLLAIEDHRFEPFDRAEVEKFDLRTVCRKLDRLSHAVERTHAATQPGPRGAPSAVELDAAMERLLASLEEAGLPVEITQSGSRTVRRKVGGTGGALLLALFSAWDRYTNTAQIWGAIERVRSRRSVPG